MERSNKQSRDELDRLRTELSRQDSRVEGLLSNVEKTAAQMEPVVKERDEARERQEAQAEIAKLKGG
jgi:hypothetical protein